jgi:heme/copper-type cytochrome/quinol oxidase subunit 3
MTEDDSANPSLGALKPGFHPPTRTGTIGMYLFLASLFMLFAAGMLGYVLIRTSPLNTKKLSLGSLEVPEALWISSAIVIAASITIQRAVRELRREKQKLFRRWLLITMVLAIIFVIVQAPSMLKLLSRQKEFALYGLVFVLILLHALHVLGGVVALGWTLKRAAEGAYDHEHYLPVGRVALYWHFLDAVWLVMFLTFWFVK